MTNPHRDLDYKSLAIWALGRTGLSSKCIARHMMGLDTDGAYPVDGADFVRCETLLTAVPELRQRLPEMAKVNRYWAALVPRWDEIATAKNQHDVIQSIIRPIHGSDPNHISLGGGISVTIGRRALTKEV